MKRLGNSKKRKVGRPLSFDREQALNEAMLRFWRHGYESTSVGELTEAMKITAPSLYAAFGDKKGLFLAAVQKYISGPITPKQIIRDACSSREAANNLMLTSALGFTQPDKPAGCLLASAGASCSDSARDVQKVLSGIRRKIEEELVSKIQGDIDAGRLPPETVARPLASLCMTVIQGMSTLARDGAGRQKLVATVEAAMQAWPASTAYPRAQA